MGTRWLMYWITLTEVMFIFSLPVVLCWCSTVPIVIWYQWSLQVEIITVSGICFQVVQKRKKKTFSMRKTKGEERKGVENSTNVCNSVKLWRVLAKSVWMIILVFLQLFRKFGLFRIKTLMKIRQYLMWCFLCSKY